MSKQHVGYLVAGLFTILEIVIIGLGYGLWFWPPAILIPASGILTFFGVMIIVNLFSQSDDLRKGEIRNAIAASLLVVYFFLITVTLFAPASPSPRSNQPEFADAASRSAVATAARRPVSPEAEVSRESTPSETEQSTTDSGSVTDISNGLLSGFTKLMMIVVGFYFGGRSAEEIVKNAKGRGSSKAGNGSS